MTKDEALKMAVLALDINDECECGRSEYQIGKLVVALQACKEALEQPAQEPVAFDCKNCHACLKSVKGETGYPITMTRMIVCPDCGNKRCPKATDHRHFCTNSNDTNQAGSIYNTHPAPSWQGLSDEEIKGIALNSVFWYGFNLNKFDWMTYTKVIEQALKEKNHG